MTTSMRQMAVNLPATLGWGVGIVLLVAALTTVGLGGPASAKDPAVYKTPEAAAQAILDALAKEDREAILAVLGDEFKDELFTEEEFARAGQLPTSGRCRQGGDAAACRR